MAFVTTKQWAALHDWTVQHANRRIKALGIPRNSEGLIDSEVAEARLAGKHVPPSETVPTSPQSAEGTEQAKRAGDFFEMCKSDLERLVTIEDLRKKRLKNDEDEGILLSANDVLRTWERHREAVKNRLLLVESKVPAEARQIVGREIREALRDLSEYSPDAA